MTAPRYEIHEAECRGFKFGVVLDDCTYADGENRTLHRHLCQCSGSRMVAVDADELKELVEAAKELATRTARLYDHSRLLAALQPFRAEPEVK